MAERKEQFTCLCSNTMTRHCFAYYYILKTEPVSYVRQGTRYLTQMYITITATIHGA